MSLRKEIETRTDSYLSRRNGQIYKLGREVEKAVSDDSLTFELAAAYSFAREEQTVLGAVAKERLIGGGHYRLQGNENFCPNPKQIARRFGIFRKPDRVIK